MKRIFALTAGLLALALSAPALATSTTTDTSLTSGPVKQMLHCFTSGANNGRCITPTVPYDQDGVVVNPASADNQATTNSLLTGISAKMPASLGIKVAASSFSIAPASDATFSVAGTVADNAVDGGNSVKFGCKYNATTVQFGDTARGSCQIETNGALLTRPWATYSNSWTYAAAAGGIVNTTTAVTIKAATASRRNCIVSVQIFAQGLGTATEFLVRDGAGGTVLWRTWFGGSGGDRSYMPQTPICSSVNTLVEVVTTTATITGAVYVNAQGFTTP